MFVVLFVLWCFFLEKKEQMKNKPVFNYS